MSYKCNSRSGIWIRPLDSQGAESIIKNLCTGNTACGYLVDLIPVVSQSIYGYQDTGRLNYIAPFDADDNNTLDAFCASKGRY